MEHILHEGRRLAFWTAGAGAPVILIHGSLATSATWRRVAATLEGAGLRLIAPDLPGWGESDAEPENCASLIEHEARALEALARAEREPVSLVAHSYGCNVALVAALGGRIALRSLVLFEPTFVSILQQAGDREAYAEIERFEEDYRRGFAAGDKSAVGKVIDLWGGAGSYAAMPEGARNAIAAWVPRNLRHWQQRHAAFGRLDSLRVPTTLIVSGRAHPAARLVAQRMHERIARSRVAEIPGANHFMIFTHPAETARLIRQSLSP